MSTQDWRSEKEVKESKPRGIRAVNQKMERPVRPAPQDKPNGKSPAPRVPTPVRPSVPRVPEKATRSAMTPLALGNLQLPKDPHPISPHSQTVLDGLTGAIIGTAWQPMIDVSESAPRPTGSFFGGGSACIPLWPVCLECKTPLTLICQIDRQTLIHPLQGNGVVQLFACCKHPGLPAVWATTSQIGSASVAPPSVAQLPLRRIVKWLPRKDFAHPEQAADLLGRALSKEEWEVLAEVQIRSDKVGGFPCWLEPRRHLACTLCAAPMRLLLQVDSGDNIPLTWGKDGCVLVFECPTHPEQVHALLSSNTLIK